MFKAFIRLAFCMIIPSFSMQAYAAGRQAKADEIVGVWESNEIPLYQYSFQYFLIKKIGTCGIVATRHKLNVDKIDSLIQTIDIGYIDDGIVQGWEKCAISTGMVTFTANSKHVEEYFSFSAEDENSPTNTMEIGHLYKEGSEPFRGFYYHRIN